MSESHTVTFTINSDKVPEVFLKDPELSSKIASQLFETYCSTLTTNTVQKTNLDLATNSILSATESFKDVLANMITMTSKSQQIGKVFEKCTEDFITQTFPRFSYTNTSLKSHSGDGLLKTPYGLNIMIEMKCYSASVAQDQITKLKYDMEVSDVNYAIMISYNSSICTKNQFDIERFEEKTIIYISHVKNDNSKITSAILLCELIYKEDKSKTLSTDVSTSTNVQLRSIVQNVINMSSKITQIKNNFATIERDIRNSLNSQYLFIRDAELEMQTNIKQLLPFISQPVSETDIDGKQIENAFSNRKGYAVFLNLKRTVFDRRNFTTSLNENLVIVKDEMNLHVCSIKVNIKSSIMINFNVSKLSLCVSNETIEQDCMVINMYLDSIYNL